MEDKKIITTKSELLALIGAASAVCSAGEPQMQAINNTMFTSKLAFILVNHLTGERKMPEFVIQNFKEAEQVIFNMEGSDRNGTRQRHRKRRPQSHTVTCVAAKSMKGIT